MQIRNTQHSLRDMDEDLLGQQHVLEKELMGLVNEGHLDIQEIGSLKIVISPIDKYNSRPKFRVDYPWGGGYYDSHEHYLRVPNKEKQNG